MTTNHTGTSPDTVVDSDDPGDDTARRYRYQWTYAAIMCCMMLDPTENVSEIFCEHHEDVLLKYNDGTFSGKQIKTRQSDQTPWNTTHDGVKKAFSRFVRLEAEFPNYFCSFQFLTNHPFQSTKNGQDLCYVIDQIKRATKVDDVTGPPDTFLSQVARDAGCTKETAFTALCKSSASDDLPKLSDILSRLVNTLTMIWSPASECSFSSVSRAARCLVTACEAASSLAHVDTLPAYIAATIAPDEREVAARLMAKRINGAQVLNILEQGLNEMATLEGNPENYVEPGIGELDLLGKKLDAGGFSAVSLNSASDLRDKADYLGIVWTQKYGRDLGLQRYNHVRSIVLREAANALEATRSEDDQFGFDMLTCLRSQFRQRRTDGAQLYDCSDEHLEGVAYSLTSECKVQWSIKRPWEAD